MFPDPPDLPAKQARLTEFLRRLAGAPAARSYEEARRQLAAILLAVEDEMTEIPFEPDAWRGDGRMYPPRDDAERASGRAGCRRFRSKGHNVIFGSNGAIWILDAPLPGEAWEKGNTVFDKPGEDGRRVRDL